MSVSVIIPARNEIYLAKTIESVCKAAKGDYEVIAVLDGYWPEPAILDHPSVRVVHLTEPVGQRAATNIGMRLATKKYVMKIDAHTIMDDGFDVKLAADCQPDWTICPLMYGLDVEKWEPKLHKRPVSYMYIGNWDDRKIRIQYWREYEKRPEGQGPITDLMAGMGNCWFMERERYWQLGGLDENHGSWGQMGIEIACKTWLSGGRHVLSRNTWFAHWFRKNEGWPYPQSASAIETARSYSTDMWQNNRWPKQVRTFQWLINKFAPVPTWEYVHANPESWIEAFHDHLCNRGATKDGSHDRHPQWEGVIVRKWPEDMLNYAEVIFECKPEIIVETGTWKGGSTLYFARLLDALGCGQVVSIDVLPGPFPQHPRIAYLQGSSTDDAIVAKVKEMAGDKRCMVVLDSLHTRQHVKWELHKYHSLVTPGQYLVVEDAFAPMHKLRLHHQPLQAAEWFLGLKEGKGFDRTDRDKRFLISADLWLKKK